MTMMKMMKALRGNESGASAAEYALLVALIGAAIVVGARALGTSINNKLSTVAATVTTG